MPSSTPLWFSGILALSVLLGWVADERPSQHPRDVLLALARLAESRAPNVSVALGYNVCVSTAGEGAGRGLPPPPPPPPPPPARPPSCRCVDAIARWDAVLSAADRAPRSDAADAAFLSTREQAVGAFQHFFASGYAAERSSDPAVLAPLVQAAMSAPSTRSNLGGNAGLMARKIARTGLAHSVVLGGHIGPRAREMLPPTIALASRQEEADEVHLILEYAKGDALAPAGPTAPRANRFIITADTSNQDAGAMVATVQAADAAGVDVLVVAGLHMMEPLPALQRQRSLSDIGEALAAARTPFSVHIELASAASHEYVRSIATTLFPHAHSLGFNEQEAAFLYTALGGQWAAEVQPAGTPAWLPHTSQILSSSASEPAAVAHLLRFLFAHPAAARITRLHFHSLAWHVLAYRDDGMQRWFAHPRAVAAGAVAGSLDACQATRSTVRADQVVLLQPLSFPVTDPTAAAAAHLPGGANGTFSLQRFNLSSIYPTATWVWTPASAPAPVGDSGNGTSLPGASLQFSLAPVPVCAVPVSTVGLGDAISASGLAADVVPLAARGHVLGGVWEEQAMAPAARLTAVEVSWPAVGWLRRVVGTAPLLVAMQGWDAVAARVGRLLGRVSGGAV
jgi:hypothetical protein